MYFKMQLIIIE